MINPNHQLRMSLLTAGIVCVALTSSVAKAEAGSDLGAWKDYAVLGMTPEFDWAKRPSVISVEPTLLNALTSRTSLAPKVELTLMDAQSAFSVSVSRALAGDTPLFEGGGLQAQQVTAVGRGLERTLIAPALSRSVSDSAVLTGGVVFAYQQFATRGLGAGWGGDAVWNSQTPFAYSGSSYGTGVRLGLEQSLSDRVVLRSDYQSRIDMTALQNYRGLYSRPGDFDLPAVATVGVSFDSGATSELSFAASRVMYSDIPAFTSPSLPVRFLALLGDSGSPLFNWRDLTVMSLDWTWSPASASTLGLHYTTRQQPEPESQALRDALSDDYSSGNLGVSFTRDFEHVGSLRLAASYAPAQYFLGSSSFSNRNASGDQVEVEAVWSLAF